MPTDACRHIATRKRRHQRQPAVQVFRHPPKCSSPWHAVDEGVNPAACHSSVVHADPVILWERVYRVRCCHCFVAQRADTAAALLLLFAALLQNMCKCHLLLHMQALATPADEVVAGHRAASAAVAGSVRRNG